MIPKLIHQFWYGAAKPPVHMMATWREQNPGWTYRLWDGSEFPLTNAKQFHDGKPSIKSDIARWEILAKFGGVYADADAACLRPLDDFIPQVQRSMFLVQDGGRKTWVCTTPVGCPPGHPIALEMIARIGRLKMTKGQHTSAGPPLLTKVLRLPAYGRLAQVFPWQTWNQPLDYVGSEAFGLHALFSYQQLHARIYAWRPTRG